MPPQPLPGIVLRVAGPDLDPGVKNGPDPSVADPGCLSRIMIFTHPGSRISDPGSRIPDPKTAIKERGEKKLFVIPFFVTINFKKFKINLFL
jgi:hypothetical protein